jgi:hypothetical protein
MNPKVFCALFLAANIGAEHCLRLYGKPHIDLSRYQEEPRLTYFVNSTATAAIIQPFWYMDYQ